MCDNVTGVRVKPLVWDDEYMRLDLNSFTSQAVGVAIVYTIACSLDHPDFENEVKRRKAAAQEHHEARILAVIEPDPDLARLRAEQSQTVAANAALVEREARLKEALEFYADPSNYRGRMDVRGYQDYQLIAAPIDQDNRGDRARAALSPAAGNGGA